MTDSNGLEEAAKRQVERQIGHFFWASAVIGLALAAAGVGLQSQGLLGTTTSQLILCSGLGILFGAFGSTATIRYKGAVIVGVAAVSIVTLLVVDYLVRDDFVRVRIDGPVKGAQVELVAASDYSYYGRADPRYYEFLLVGDIKADKLGLYITFPKTEDKKEREVPFPCIAPDRINPYLGSGRTLQWRYDEARGLLLDSAGEPIASIGCPDNTAVTGDPLPTLGLSFVRSAYAADISEMLRQLESSSTIERRGARSQLAASGPQIVQPLLEAFADPAISYRLQLGIVVSLTEMLRENKSTRQSISQMIKRDDLARLIEASADPDRTIRTYASEFLFDLGDTRVVPIAFDSFATASDDGKYSLLLVVQGTLPYLSSTERARAEAMLADIRPNVGPKTQNLIDKITAR